MYNNDNENFSNFSSIEKAIMSFDNLQSDTQIKNNYNNKVSKNIGTYGSIFFTILEIIAKIVD